MTNEAASTSVTSWPLPTVIPKVQAWQWLAPEQGDPTPLLSLLSPEERAEAARRQDAEELAHFIRRRAFQRHCLIGALGWQAASANLPLVHRRDRPPLCPLVPDLALSFSSSGPMMVAAMARAGRLGIDVEALRPVSAPLDLAERFFHARDIAWLAAQPESRRAAAFQRLWTIKEACLKAMGTGVVGGLTLFPVAWREGQPGVTPPVGSGTAADWQVDCQDLPHGYILTLALWCDRTRAGQNC